MMLYNVYLYTFTSNKYFILHPNMWLWQLALACAEALYKYKNFFLSQQKHQLVISKLVGTVNYLSSSI
jgi:hypothetical protein